MWWARGGSQYFPDFHYRSRADLLGDWLRGLPDLIGELNLR
jgi:hypothetical protein